MKMKSALTTSRLVKLNLLDYAKIAGMREPQENADSLLERLVKTGCVAPETAECGRRISGLSEADFEFLQKARALFPDKLPLRLLALESERLERERQTGKYRPLRERLVIEHHLQHSEAERIQSECDSWADGFHVSHLSGDMSQFVRDYTFERLDSARCSVGRDSNAEIRLPYRELSRGIHAEISRRDGRFFVEPAAKDVRVSLNGKAISRISPLEHYDYIDIGTEDGSCAVLLFKEREQDFTTDPEAASHGRLPLVEFDGREIEPRIALPASELDACKSEFGRLFRSADMRLGRDMRITVALLRLYGLMYPRAFQPCGLADSSLEQIGELALCFVSCHLLKDLDVAALGYWPQGKEPLLSHARIQGRPKISIPRPLLRKCLETPSGVAFFEDRRMSMIVPLFHEEGASGFLYAEKNGEAQAARQDMLAVFASASSLGTALQNAIGIQRMKEKAVLEDDLADAAQIQESILPCVESVPCLEVRCRIDQTLQVGGDYCDLIPSRSNDRSFSLVIGDAMGHGVRASLMAMTFRAYLRPRIGRGEAIEGVLAEIDQALYSDFQARSPNPLYMMASVWVWDADSKVLKWYDAGFQCRPLLLEKQTRLVRALDRSKSMPLGMSARPQSYSVEFVPLQEGDTLLLHTDGLVEAKNPAGAEFGEENVAGCLEEAGRQGLSLEETLDLIFGRLSEFTRVNLCEKRRRDADGRNLVFWAQQWDDISVLALKRVAQSDNRPVFRNLKKSESV